MEKKYKVIALCNCKLFINIISEVHLIHNCCKESTKIGSHPTLVSRRFKLTYRNRYCHCELLNDGTNGKMTVSISGIPEFLSFSHFKSTKLSGMRPPTISFSRKLFPTPRWNLSRSDLDSDSKKILSVVISILVFNFVCRDFSETVR